MRILLRGTQYEQRPQRLQYDGVVREIIQYCRPDLAMYVGAEGEQYQGEKRGTTMYTSKVATDLERAADAFVGNLLHPGDWFRYRTRIPWLNGNNEVQRYLQDREEQFNEVFSRSNFYTQAPGAVMDALSIGNHAVFAESDSKTRETVCNAIHMLSAWWSLDKHGNLTAFHQKHLFDAIEAFRLFKDRCSEGLLRDIKENRPLEKHEFIQAVYMTDDPVIGDYRLKYPKRPFVEFWIQTDSDRNSAGDTGVLSEEPFNAMPFILWPYRRTGDESVGRGALHISSVKRLNNQHRTMMLTAQRAAQQPLAASAALEGRIHLGPDGVTFLENADEIVRPIYGSGQVGYPFGIEYLERMEQELENVLDIPMFLQLSQMTKEATAYEVWQRMGERAVVAGPRLVPMERYYLRPLHERFWQIEMDAGRVPDPPDILAAAARHPKYRHFNGDLVTVEFMGPLTQIQQLFLYMRRMIGLWGSIQPLAAADPRALRKIDVIRSVEHILDAGGWPQDCIVPDEEIARQDAQAAAMQREQMMSEGIERESKAIKNLSRKVEPDSPMDMMMGAGR